MPDELRNLDVSHLIERCNQGDGRAWEEFYGRYVGIISCAVKGYFKSDHENIEDVIQEVFLCLLNALKGYDPTRSIEAYIIEIARRVKIGRFRRANSLKRGGGNPRPLSINAHDSDNRKAWLTLASQTEDQETSLISAQERQILRQALLGLSEGCRTVLALRYDRGLSYKEISEALAVHEGTLRVRVQRCLSSLATLYSEAARQEVEGP